MKQSFEEVGKLFTSPKTWLYSWKSEKKNFEFLQTLLKEDEEIKLSFGGLKTTEKDKLESVGEGLGLFLITNERVLHGQHKFGVTSFNELKLTKETNINGQGMDSFVGGAGWIHIKNTNHELWIGGLNGGKKEVNKILEVLKEVISRIDVSNSSENIINNSGDNLDKIKKLKELFDLGILSIEEFETKKKELLDGI